MNYLSKFAVCFVAMATAFPVLADDADTLLDRAKTLESMSYKRDQLKLQGDMSESWKKMSDAGVIVDQDGIPLGVESIQKMAIEVRKQGRVVDGNPFDAGGPGSTPNGIAPNGMPFMSDQQASMPPQPFQSPPASYGSRHQQTAPQAAEAEKKLPVEEEKILQLIKVEASSVTIRSNDGDHVLRIGEKVNDLTLTKFSIDQAFLKGPKGMQTISINWTLSK